MSICKDIKLKAEAEKCLFTNSFMSTTIQDGSMRERSDISHYTTHLSLK